MRLGFSPEMRQCGGAYAPNTDNKHLLASPTGQFMPGLAELMPFRSPFIDLDPWDLIPWLL